MEAQKHHSRKTLTRAMDEHRWDDAMAEVESQLAAKPHNASLLRTKFKVLATGRKNGDTARACADAIFETIEEDAKALNKFAWALLTEDQYEGAYNDVALRFSTRSNELTGNENWMFLDTLAVAKFENGDVAAAVAFEKLAIAHSNEKSKKALDETLARFERAADDQELAVTADRR